MSYFTDALEMTQAEREQLFRTPKAHPSRYCRRAEEPGEPLQPPESRSPEESDAIVVELRDLLNEMYSPYVVHMNWAVKPKGWRSSFGRHLLAGKTAPPYGFIPPDETALRLWWRDQPCVRSVELTANSGAMKVELHETATKWFDETGRLHRTGGPAVISPGGNDRHYYHGDAVDARVFKDPMSIPVAELLRDPTFSAIGGFPALAKNPHFTCIVSEGDVGIYEGGGVMTYWNRYRMDKGDPPQKGARIWSVKPKRFLLDPKGISGWVSNSVTTIAGAQRSLLRRKLTQGRPKR